MTTGQKAKWVLLLSMGLRKNKNKVAAVLVAHGFSDDDIAEGWRLLQHVTRTRLPGGDDARKILAKRGLSKAVIDETKQLLACAGKLEPAPPLLRKGR